MQRRAWMELPQNRFLRGIYLLVQRYLRHNVGMQGAALAFYLLFMIFPLLIFVSSWGNDTCAYLVGRAIGKHKMSPILSPKKSIEGLIGGIVGAGILGVVFGLIYNHFMQVVHSVWIFALIGAVCALPAVIGDLAASAIKRNNDIKDYGKLIPGHGGILDRFDSIIFTAPIMYYLILYLL